MGMEERERERGGNRKEEKQKRETKKKNKEEKQRRETKREIKGKTERQSQGGTRERDSVNIRETRESQQSKRYRQTYISRGKALKMHLKTHTSFDKR